MSLRKLVETVNSCHYWRVYFLYELWSFVHRPISTFTYIIGHYNPSVKIIDLVSHTTYVVCVNFIHKWRDLQFKVDSERQIYWELFMAILFTLRVFARNLLRGNRRRNTFRISFFDDWPGIRTQAFASNKPTRYLLDYGDLLKLMP